MEDKIILKFKTKNILNFYEIEPWCMKLKINKTKQNFTLNSHDRIFTLSSNKTEIQQTFQSFCITHAKRWFIIFVTQNGPQRHICYKTYFLTYYVYLKLKWQIEVTICVLEMLSFDRTIIHIMLIISIQTFTLSKCLIAKNISCIPLMISTGYLELAVGI